MDYTDLSEIFMASKVTNSIPTKISKLSLSLTVLKTNALLGQIAA